MMILTMVLMNLTTVIKMCKKIAIFVEGQTEQIFVIRLLLNIAGSRGFSLEIQRQHKNALHQQSLIIAANPDYYFLIANCCNDEQVKSQINDRYIDLCNAGYSHIIGLRDAYPLFDHSTLKNAGTYVNTGIPRGRVPVNLHLAVMEIEAWFLEETSHFQRVNPTISTAHLVAAGFDPTTIKAQSLPTPAKTMHTIYRSVGNRYDKNKQMVSKVVNALCYETLYIDTRTRSSSLDHFVQRIENAMF